MSETKEYFLTSFLNEKLIPFSMKVSQNKYIQAIGQGSMGLMAIIMIGAVFNLLNTIPIDAWQNMSPKHSKLRHFEMEDYCGFWIETPDGKIWMPGDSRLMEEQLTYEHPDLILMDISDGSWHIGMPGVKKLTDTYDDSKLIPIHWGCVHADWKEFNGDPAAVRDMIIHPERLLEVPCGEAVRLEKIA